MTASKKVFLSGIQSTGDLHLGNYFGALKQFVDLQDQYEGYVFIANYHALTTLKDKKELEENTLNTAIDYLAAGLDPKKVTLYLQSDVPEVTELAWIFSTLITVPYLSRAHAYKDKVARGIEPTVGLFNYPVLMAADILIMNPDVVPVGEDQSQHVEMARDIAEKFNRIYGKVFKTPGLMLREEVATVPGTDGQKMSKSYKNTIALFGTDKEIKKTVMSIVTDSSTKDDKKDPEKDNVFALHKLVSGGNLPEIEKKYKDGGMGHQESKELLAENIIAMISPMRKRREDLLKNKDEVIKVLKNGGEVARSSARASIKKVKESVGLI